MRRMKSVYRIIASTGKMQYNCCAMKTWAREATTADIPGMLRLDHSAFRHAKYRQSNYFLNDWLSRSSGNLFVLLDQHETICGRADCLPVDPIIVMYLKENKCPLDNSLISKFLLPIERVKKAAATAGNTLFTGMVVVDPRTNRENYGMVAGPLFDKFGEKFQELRMVAVIGRSFTKAAEHVWRHRAGGVVISRNAQSIVWYCDAKTADEKGGAGLPTIIKVNLAKDSPPNPDGEEKYERFLKRLTPRELEILNRMLRGQTVEKILATEFHVSHSTIHTHITHIHSKAHEEIGNMGKAGWLAFCAQFHRQ